MIPDGFKTFSVLKNIDLNKNRIKTNRLDVVFSATQLMKKFKSKKQYYITQDHFFQKKCLYSRVSNRRDSPLINYSDFCHPPQPY